MPGKYVDIVQKFTSPRRKLTIRTICVGVLAKPSRFVLLTCATKTTGGSIVRSKW